MLKPILFNTEMVRAILDGRKTVTRRTIKPQPKMRIVYCCGGHGAGKWDYPSPEVYKYWGDEYRIPDDVILDEEDMSKLWTPPCHTGDVLYVRETWARLSYVDEDGYTHYDQPMYFYKADGRPDIILRDDDGAELDDQQIRWRPSIHMPKEAAKIFLKVTNVSVERLQDMSMQDSLAEGVKLSLNGMVGDNGQEINAVHGDDIISLTGITDSGKKGAMKPFVGLWNSTISRNDLDIYGWEANPWVWKIDFERIDKDVVVKEGLI